MSLIVEGSGRLPSCRPLGLRGLAGFVAVLVITFMGGVAVAQQAALNSSLKLVPQSTAFYAASMNHAAMWQAIVGSNAYQQLNKTPAAVKMRKAYRSGLFRGWEQFGDNPMRYYLEGWSQSIDSVPGKIAMPFVRQLFGNEVFVYGDEDWLKFSAAFSQAYNEMSPIIAEMQKSDDPNDYQKLWPVIRKYAQGINTPTLVVGAVLDEPAAFSGMFDLAASGIEQGLTQVPPELDFVVDGYEKINGSDTHLLTLTVKGKDIPWEEIGGEDEEFAEIVPFLQEVCADKSVCVAMGLKGNLLLFSFGPSIDHIKQLGTGPLLIDQPLLAPVKAAMNEGKKLTSVTFVSEAMAQANTNFEHAFDFLPAIVEKALAESRDHSIDEQSQKKLVDELRVAASQFGADLTRIMPRSGAQIGYSFLQPNGIEGYAINHGENKSQDDSAPISLLQHIGQHPAAFVLSRNKASTDQYELLQKWGHKAYEFAEEYAPKFAESAGENSDQVRKALQELRPFLDRLDAIVGKRILPQFDGGEGGIVIDLSHRRPSWFGQMPSVDAPVPLPAVAVIAQIKDKKVLVEAGADLMKLANDLVDWVRDQVPDGIPPDFFLPDPESNVDADSEMYYYQLPAEADVDDALVPHVRLTSDFMLLGYLTDQTADMVQTHSPTCFGPAAESGKAMQVAFFDNRQLIDAIDAWVQYASRISAAQGQPFELNGMGESDALDMSEAEIQESLSGLYQFLKCFQGISSRSYMSDGAQQTHYLWRFEDVPPK